MSTLREQVTQAMRETERVRWPGTVAIHDHHAMPLADAAIGVVLAAVADEIKALPRCGYAQQPPALYPKWSPGGARTETFPEHDHVLRDAVLAVVERLRG